MNDKSFEIFVNTRPKVWSEPRIGFDDVVRLAYENPPASEQVIFTVKYRHGKGQAMQTLDEGADVKVTDQMVFDVGHSNRS